MKTIIVSGFLGSGKTTFIEHLSKRLDDVAILENDYARANIDRKLLPSEDGEIFSLEEGCICCSKQADFATTVVSISTEVKPEYLIIEPTGVGYLSKVLANIKPIEYENIKVLQPITIVDYHQIDQTLKKYGKLFLDQLKNAGHILLSKIEKVKEEDIKKAVEMLQKHCSAKIYDKHYSQFSEEEWQELLEEYDYESLLLEDSKNLSLDSIVFRKVYFQDFHSLGTAINAVCEHRFGEVLRGKGVVQVEDKFVKVDIVQGRFDVVKYEGNTIDELVFIGKDLDRHAFEILFQEQE